MNRRNIALVGIAGAVLAVVLLVVALRILAERRREKADEASRRYHQELVQRIEDQEADSKEAIALFHQQFSEQKFDEIAARASWFKPTNNPRWLDSMQRLRRRLGEFRSVKDSKVMCFWEPSNLCSASYVSVYEQGEATEHFRLSFYEHLVVQLESADVRSEHLPEIVEFKFGDP